MKEFQPSIRLDGFWYTMAERQAIHVRRQRGDTYPWTEFPIFRKYKFTNVYRVLDRVSQYLIRNVIYDEDRSPEDVLMRIFLFKLFNRISTWEFIVNEFGEPTAATLDVAKWGGALQSRMNSGLPLYGGAYQIPCHSGPVYPHLRIVEHSIEHKLWKTLAGLLNLEDVYRLFLEYRGIGKFMAYQMMVDVNYSEVIDFDEDDFVVAGPGCRAGMIRCFQDPPANAAQGQAILEVVEAQQREFKRLGIDFPLLYGRPLSVVDIEHWFCEFDKYERAASGLFNGNRYREPLSPIKFKYPPKWGLKVSC